MTLSGEDARENAATRRIYVTINIDNEMNEDGKDYIIRE